MRVDLPVLWVSTVAGSRGGATVALKLAVVGGGSTYTPELIEGIARRSQRLAVDELVLLDIDAERLEIVGGLARRMMMRWTDSAMLSQEPANGV